MYGWESQVLGRERLKSRAKTRKIVIFPGKSGQLFQFCPGRIEALFYTFFTQIILKCPRKYQKTHNFEIFLHFPKFAPLLLSNFEENPKFDHIPMYVLLKFHYAKFGVSNFYQRLSKKNLWGFCSIPPPPPPPW